MIAINFNINIITEIWSTVLEIINQVKWSGVTDQLAVTSKIRNTFFIGILGQLHSNELL